ASAADLAPRIERVGARHEESFDRARLERLAAEADVAVFPGIAPETYALVVDEALALGLPVIVSDRGAGAERAGEAALVVPAGDVDALRDALAGLLDDPGRLDTLRARIVEHVATVDDGAARLDEIYGAAVGTEPTPAPAHASLPTERLAALDRVVARHRRERASASSNGAGAPEVVAGDEAAASPPPPPPPPPEVARRGFDPEFRFVPLLPFEEVPGGRVVVLAPHPDDEVIGAGGALALHAARGDEVTVVHVTDGGATAARDGRRREAEAAGAELGVRRFRGLDFPDGGLRPGGAFESGLMGVLHTLRPDVLYVPSPFEHHPDHRATLALAAGALARGGLAPEVVLYEVNEPQQAGYLLDVTSVLEKKRAALERFESQRGTLDVVEKTLTANRARTVNVDLPAVRAAEAYLRVRPDALDRWIDAVFALRALVPEVAAAGGVAAAAAAPSATLLRGETVPVTCVISTWNKCDDVRENLLALHRQTRPPAEIVVVDNASKDGTQEMIRTEFPDVRLIVTPHDRIGACETFNMGFKAATQPLTAIMDDDVVAPPDWLEKLVTRLEREPESTAMVSSKVVEPGMPEEFLTSDAVNRERYMATFRGCGTLARTDVIRAAGLYDEEFFIYGNERDLATRVLNLGHRILQYPPAEIFHKTPFGLKPGKRSLYYHVRNFWLYAFKNCSWGQVLRAGWTLGLKGLGLKKDRGHASDATGTIGIDRSVKETPGGLWIAIKATLAALALLPYCLRHRHVCTHPDFEPPVQ
ncbi:MAG: glycosyltransferase, partial [Planctomycetota bacterium JB042]